MPRGVVAEMPTPNSSYADPPCFRLPLTPVPWLSDSSPHGGRDNPWPAVWVRVEAAAPASSAFFVVWNWRCAAASRFSMVVKPEGRTRLRVCTSDQTRLVACCPRWQAAGSSSYPRRANDAPLRCGVHWTVLGSSLPRRSAHTPHASAARGRHTSCMREFSAHSRGVTPSPTLFTPRILSRRFCSS